MADKDQPLTLLWLQTMFPELESKINLFYNQDPVFREIASEYHECIRQEAMLQETGRRTDYYSDTINELKEELLEYLENMQSSNHLINNQ